MRIWTLSSLKSWRCAMKWKYIQCFIFKYNNAKHQKQLYLVYLHKSSELCDQQRLARCKHRSTFSMLKLENSLWPKMCSWLLNCCFSGFLIFFFCSTTFYLRDYQRAHFPVSCKIYIFFISGLGCIITDPTTTCRSRCLIPCLECPP